MMNGLDKIELISEIGRELQSRMTFEELNILLKTYGVDVVDNPIKYYHSKWTYVKNRLADIEDQTIIRIARELSLEHSIINEENVEYSLAETTFWDPGYFKLFISHLASYRKNIGFLKSSLKEYGISSFVAHEDIEPTKEWQIEIEKALYSMDALCAVLMPGFKESDWTDQEVGVAIGRNKLIIPIRKGKDPYGFIGKYQGFQAEGKNIGEVAEGIFTVLITHEKTKLIMIEVLSDLLLRSPLATTAKKWLDLIIKIENIPISMVKKLRAGFIRNKNLDNKTLRYEFNEFLDEYGLDYVLFEEFELEKPVIDDGLPF